MSTTYKQIGSAQVAGSGGAAAFTFSSIPSIFTDLIIKLSARDNRDGQVLDDVKFIINGSSASVYTMMRVAGFPSSALISGASTSATEAGVGFVTGTAATASIFGNSEYYIPNYRSNALKSISVDGVSENNAALSGLVFNALSVNITTPITSIELRPFSTFATVFNQYSTAYLYGVSNA
jgi:hypothetical protein